MTEKIFLGDLIKWLNEKEVYPKNTEYLSNILDIEELDFCFENIQDFPPTLKYLRKVKRVCLALNNLDFIPDFIFKLKSLEVLELDMNKFSELPTTIGSINTLKKLLLGYNNLTCLPNIFERLENLEYIDIKNNDLLSLPHSLETLNRLEYLNLSGNKDLLIPQWVWKSTSLKKLIISEEMIYPKNITSLFFELEVIADPLGFNSTRKNILIS